MSKQIQSGGMSRTLELVKVLRAAIENLPPAKHQSFEKSRGQSKPGKGQEV
jgi:hypothetical protein